MVLLNLTSTGSEKPQDFQVYFNYPLEYSSDNEIALIGCNMWYSWHNLSPKFDTNKLKYYDGKKWETIIFPEGNYDFDDIQDYINDHFKTDDPPISIIANTVTLRTIILLKPNYQVDLRESDSKGEIISGNLHKIFGFKAETISQLRTESEKKADITRGVDRILIHCSI